MGVPFSPGLIDLLKGRAYITNCDAPFGDNRC